jgi:two-component system OmpR family response regulator
VRPAVQGSIVVLVVDDDPTWAELVTRVLRLRGMQVSTTQTSLGASNLVRRLQPDVVLLDVDLPALSGDALVGLLRRSAPARTRIVLHSAHDTGTLRAVAARVGADGSLSKSTELDTLVDYVARIAKS